MSLASGPQAHYGPFIKFDKACVGLSRPCNQMRNEFLVDWKGCRPISVPCRFPTLEYSLPTKMTMFEHRSVLIFIPARYIRTFLFETTASWIPLTFTSQASLASPFQVLGLVVASRTSLISQSPIRLEFPSVVLLRSGCDLEIQKMHKSLFRLRSLFVGFSRVL